MTHYEERLAHDLEDIRRALREVAKRVATALDDATHAALSHDRARASMTILRDLPINRAIREIDRQCHAFVARHLPSAGHLRFVSSVLRLDIELERIGDYAVTVARETAQLSGPPPETVARDIELISEQARTMFSQSVEAFLRGNAELARGTLAMSKQINSTFDKVYADLLQLGEEQRAQVGVKELFAWLTILNRYERVSDQSKNICEESLFAETGETKAPKSYRLLFLDETNTSTSQLAEALARKAYPESGDYKSAGWTPGDELDAGLKSFLEERGFELDNARPRRLVTTQDHLDNFHVIVALQPGAREHIAELPFRTVLLEWDDITAGDTGLEEIQKRLTLRLQDLMELLRGEGAS